MALDTNFNVDPYYDDFDETKKFHRVLFKPGYAVQARELTQIQSYLQNQVGRFGNHIFKNGSVVTGGQFILQTATYLNLSSTYASTSIDANTFINTTIFDNNTYDIANNVPTVSTKTGVVLKVFSAEPTTNGAPITLMVKEMVGGVSFSNNDTIRTSSTTSPYYANVSSNGTGLLFSVDEGVFFYDGYFIQNDAQTIAISKYSYNDANASARIGFEIVESMVSSTNDTTLLDPAVNASNYQAPGADRYKIDLVLSTRSLDSVDDTKFIELMRVVNGSIASQNKYPEYAVLEDTLARRTYDESGNYTVKPFQITLKTNSDDETKADITLSPGKAYVYGYEFESVSPTTLTVNKPREFVQANNQTIGADYGNYLYVTNVHGSFPIDKLTTIDLHCVSHANINVTSSATISNTKIGTTRVKTIDYDDVNGSSTDFTKLVYRVYLFDTNIGSITGNVVSSTANTVNIGNYFAGVTNAYVGAKIRISEGPGSNESSKTILASNPTTFVLSLDDTFITTPNTLSKFSIDFESKNIKSFYNPDTANTYADIDYRSINPDGYTDVKESSTEPLIFKIGQSFVRENSIGDMSYVYKKVTENASFSAGSTTLSIPGGHVLEDVTTTPNKLENVIITVTEKGGSSYNVGDIITPDKWTYSGGTLTVTSGSSMKANLIVTFSDPSARGDAHRLKTYVSANTSQFPNRSLGVDIFANAAINVFTSNGVTEIAASIINSSTPNTSQSLYVSDVYNIIKIVDFNGKIPSTANLPGTDVTSSYTFDNGQRDSCYDHATIKLVPNASKPNGPLVVYYDKFTSTTPGFFDVDSYPTSNVSYGDIPSYTSLSSGVTYNLRDCIDFRLVRKDADANVVFNINQIPVVTSDITLDYSYYLPRIDKVVLDKDRSFKIIQGTSSLTPVRPSDTDTSMTLYILNYPAYTADTANVNIQYVQNRRYTMRDIGSIEKRVENLEYYTTLSLLEQDTLNKLDMSILDSNNLARFKNGIIADGFKGWSVADVSNSDFKAGIDITEKMLRPSFNLNHFGLTFDSANSSNFVQSGSVVTLAYTSNVFIQQTKASYAVNVNPFNVAVFDGNIVLSPQSDTWVDMQRLPDKIIPDTTGDKAVWDLVNKGYTEEWGNWNTYWTGRELTYSNPSADIGELREQWTTYQKQQRTGTGTWYTTNTIYADLGDRVVDVSIVPYMRNVDIYYSGSKFKPNSTLYPFFDNISVEKYCSVANKFTLVQNNVTIKKLPDECYIWIYNGASVIGATRVLQTSNNVIYTDLIASNASWAGLTNVWIKVQDTTAATYNVSSYELRSGMCVGATSNSITLDYDSRGQANTAFDGKTIFITNGIGAGQSATVSSFNNVTSVLTISGTWTTTPAYFSEYSFNRPSADLYGHVAGKFSVPAGIFKTGEKRFTLIDNTLNDLGSSSTSGDCTFVAQGISKTIQKEMISTMVAEKHTKALSQNRTNVSNVENLYNDPLAQSFAVDPKTYPRGVYISKVRLCFKTKDDVTKTPITLELRPTVNGYPSSTTAYPYSFVELSPEKVNISNSPDITDSSKYTEFVFQSPVYLLPGDHCMVLRSDSNYYTVYVAEIGKTDLVNGRIISEQPYGGSLFKSQNAQTWTADQNLDLMFELYRCEFSTSPALAQFEVEAPAYDLPYDAISFVTSEIQISKTQVEYDFKSTLTNSTVTGWTPIITTSTYEMDDKLGQRTLKTSSNTSLLLRATLSSEYSDVSPAIDANHFGAFLISNKINNLQLSNANIILANTGSGYSGTFDVTFDGGGGYGAAGKANVSSGVITHIYLTSEGSGYTGTPTVNLSAASASTYNGSAYIIGENQSSGGIAEYRYLIKPVTLADGFDSGDLRVYVTAYKPSGSNIYVYYKMLSSADPGQWNDKKWQLMTQLGSSTFTSTNKNDFKEIVFAPGVNGVASNSVGYDTYYNFRTFAIKVVLTGTDTTNVPKLRDFRAIALPAA